MKETYIVYGRDVCSFCNKLKAFLEDANIPYQYVDLDIETQELETLREKGLRSLPQVFTSEGDHIGGYTETVKYVQNRF